MTKLLIILSLSLITMTQDKNTNKIETTTLGSGCFWCTEAIFDRVEGVVAVVSGYSGGHLTNPTYKEVTSGTTGHAEVVQISFDKTKITYPEILQIFWNTHDPTQLNRQGNDIGSQYRSVIFYHSEEQKKHAAQLKEELNDKKIWDNPLVTAIDEYTSFYPAEDYHNEYYENNPNQGYCRFVITPKVEKFEKIFKDHLKE